MTVQGETTQVVPERVLVTGATGFIGANLVRHLLARGQKVRCIIRKPNPLLEGLDLDLVKVPLEDTPDGVDALARVADGCQGIYHVAGIFDPSPGGVARMRQVHVYGTRALLKAADKAGVERMLVCSSSITVGYGSKSSPGDEETPINPDDLYGTAGALRGYYDTKLQSEQMSLNWPGVPVVVVNPDFIIGARDVKPTSGQLIVSMAKGWMPMYPRGGKCFQDADDCAIGHILALEKGRPGRRYLLGNENLSYREFMDLIAGVVGGRKPVMAIPDFAVWCGGKVGQWGSRFDAHKFAGLDPHVLRSMQLPRYRTGARARDELGVPQTPMIEAVKKAHDWFKENQYC